MTKAELSEYMDLLSEVKKMEKRIERLNNQSPIATELVQNGYKGRLRVTGVDIVRDRVLREYAPQLELKYNELQARMTVILHWVLGIEKSSIRQIFTHRYLDGMTWNEVAQKMCVKENGSYDENVTEDAVRMKHDRYLESMGD